MNVPDVEIDCAALTEKDIEDAEFLLKLDPPIEYICVSFAQKGQDLQELIDIMDRLKVPQETWWPRGTLYFFLVMRVPL